MALLLSRIDDRLIHGQVVLGWGRPLGIEHIVLVDDAIAANEWEQDLYRMGVPDGVTAEFLSLDDAPARVRELSASARRVAVLTSDVATMSALVHGSGQTIRQVNLGGIHHRADRAQYGPYVFLSPDEVDVLREMESHGVTVEAQDLPTTPPTALRDLLG